MFTDDTVLHKQVMSLQDAENLQGGDFFARMEGSICGYSSTSPCKCHMF